MPANSRWDLIRRLRVKNKSLVESLTIQLNGKALAITIQLSEKALLVPNLFTYTT